MQVSQVDMEGTESQGFYGTEDLNFLLNFDII
jgi:hypothetical protein